MTRRPLVVLALALTPALAASCAHRAGPEQLRPATPADAGVILFMGVELPAAGTVIGGYYAGATYEVRQTSYTITETARENWTQSERESGAAIMRLVGFRALSLGPHTSDARALLGVQYGLTGRVSEVAVRSTGSAEPLTVNARLSVAWELLDLGSGSAVFGRRVEGSSRVSGTLGAAVGQALDNSLQLLIADTLFLRMLSVPRADPDAGRSRYTRRLPVGREEIELADSDLSASGDTSIVVRLSAGVVQLVSQDREHGTAILLTRDGLALAVGRSVRGLLRLGVRFSNGIERPARIVRSDAGLDVALLQVSCAPECLTVDWEAPQGVDAMTAVLVLGGPEPGSAPRPVLGSVGGRWGLAHGITLRVAGEVAGGWPIARAASGRVFAVVSAQPERRASALLLSEVLRALHVRAPGSRRS